MEKPVDLGHKTTLMNELTQGKELATELLNNLRSTSSLENRDLLISEILSSIERSFSVLNRVASGKNRAFGNSNPTSEISFQDPTQSSVVSKKRKTTPPRWTEKVTMCSSTVFEGALDDDGYSWRKYGQKVILGAKYPRAYYRCTHRNGRGCIATKQVQRSDKEGEIFEVNYKGRHTCRQVSKLCHVSKQLNKEELKVNQDQIQEHDEKVETKQSQIEAIPFILETELKAEDFDIDTDIGFKMDDIFPSFFETDFNDTMIGFENNLMGNFSPPISESNDIYLMSQDHKSSFGGVYTPESDIITEIPSNQTSVTNSPIGEWILNLDDVGIEMNFHFDNPEVFF